MLQTLPFPSGAVAPVASPSLGSGIPEHPRIMTPDEVDIPMPRQMIEEVAVPASINGRDLSRGQP